MKRLINRLEKLPDGTIKRYTGILIMISMSIVASVIIYKQVILREIQNKSVSQKGYRTIGLWNHFNQGGGYNKGDLLAVYVFTINGVKYKCRVLNRKTPEKFYLPDTLDVFYLSEDPNISRPAFEVFPEYKYNGLDEEAHKPRPIFDSLKRRYINKTE